MWIRFSTRYRCHLSQRIGLQSFRCLLENVEDCVKDKYRGCTMYLAKQIWFEVPISTALLVRSMTVNFLNDSVSDEWFHFRFVNVDLCWVSFEGTIYL